MNRPSIRKICMITGIALLVAAAVLMGLWQWHIHTSAQQAQQYARRLHGLIPTPQSAVPEPRRDNTMAVIPLEGKDFVGLIELPRYGSTLPVCDDWGRPSQYPCRLSGSAYDGTLQIGGTTQAGQYDFYREISVGDRLYFTDVEGNRFAYTVTELRYAAHADQEALQSCGAPLTLFLKNVYAMEYLLIFCDVAR